MGRRNGIVLAIKKQQKTNNQKCGVTLDGCCSMMQHTTTNQKHLGVIERVTRGGATRGEHAGGMTP
jgi:hypothetical protein